MAQLQELLQEMEQLAMLKAGVSTRTNSFTGGVGSDEVPQKLPHVPAGGLSTPMQVKPASARQSASAAESALEPRGPSTQ